MPETRSSGKLTHALLTIIINIPLTHVYSDAIPDSQKSTGQSLSDKASREKSSHTSNPGEDSVLDKAKGALGMNK